MRMPHSTSPRTRATAYPKVLAILVLLIATIGSPSAALAQTPPDGDPDGAGHIYLPIVSPGGQAGQPQGEEQSQKPAPPVEAPTPAPEDPGQPGEEEEAPPDNDIIIREVAPSDTGATVASDLPDYPPGATVTLTGLRWAPEEAVHIFVNDDVGQTWTHHSNPDPVADATGTFTYSFDLPLWFVANYGVLAKGPISGEATTTFTDLSIGAYDQCSNDERDGYASGDTGCRWIFGNLQSNNSIYYEGDATVQRVWLTGFLPGSSHTLTLKYGTTKGGKHAYDFLTTWDWSEDWVSLADRCQDIDGCEAVAAESTLNIPQDPNVPDAFEPSTPGARQFVMRGGVLNSATTPAIVSGSYGGDSETVISVNFTVDPASSPMCLATGQGKGTCGVALWFGAHVSAQANWGLGMGAGSITGSPYHVALDAVDGASVGQRDNQMQANVVTVVPNGTIIIAKDAVPDDPQDFSFNLSNASTIEQNFWLDDDADPTLPGSQIFSVPPGTWYARELLPLPAGWSLTNLVCVDPTNNTTVDLAAGAATINLASAETVTCTYTDSKAGQIIVKKVTSSGDGSFEFEPSWGDNFFLANSQTQNSGPLAAGTYSVAEVNLPPTWNLAGATCDDGSPVTAISLQEGETVTCTFNNTRVYNRDLTVTKTAEESFTRTYTWDIYKDVDKTSANIVEGGSAVFNYTVGVTHDGGADSAFVVAGTITVHNPNAFDIAGVDIADTIEDGGLCTVAGGTDLTVSAGGVATASYTCAFAANPGSGANTATATWDADVYNTPAGSASGMAAYDFAGVAPSIVSGSVNVVDSLGGNFGPVSYTDPSPKEFTYARSFAGVAGTCTAYDNTATITENGKFAKKTVEVCVGKDLTVSKTAAGSLVRTYKWLIDKRVDDTRIEIAEGGLATFNYGVEVTPNGFADSGWSLGGTITIANPNDWQEVTVDVADALDNGGTCSITEAAPYIVPKGGLLTLHYSCASDGTTTKNTATATWDKAVYYTPNGSAAGDAMVAFNLTEEHNKTITVVDDKTDPADPVTLGTWNWADGAHTFTYALDKQGVAGTCTDYTNTAVIDETEQSDSQKVTVCVGKDLTVTKTAVPTFTRTWNWTIDKTSDATYNLFAGASVPHDYKVTVTPTYVDSAWKVVGTITIINPNDWQAVEANVADSTSLGGSCVLSDPDGKVSIPAGGNVAVGYACTWATMPTSYTGLNTATVTWDNVLYATPGITASGEKDFAFTNPDEINPAITVDDDNLTNDQWSADRSKGEWTYTKNFACSNDPADYKDGTYSYSLTNTAKINETGTSDKATVAVNCFAPVVSKTADGTYDERHEWFVAKTAAPGQKAFAGGKVGYQWTVAVTEDVSEENFAVKGVITVKNPAPMGMSVELIDVLDVGTAASIAADIDCEFTAGMLTVPALGTATCGYEAAPAGKTAQQNHATATLNGIAFSASAPVAWTAKPINPSVTLEDSQNPAWPITLSDGRTISYDDPNGYQCPTDPAVYAGDGIAPIYTDSNTATITYGGTSKSATASTSVTCYGPIVSKTATAEWRKKYDWTITKTASPATHIGFAGDSFTSAYDVFVDQSITEYGYLATGTITVKNPTGAPGAMMVNVADMVSGGFEATVVCDTGAADDQGMMTVLAGSEKICNYSVGLPDKTSRINTATATFNDIGFLTTADVVFGEPIIEGFPTIDVTDNVQGALGSASGDQHFTYDRSFNCSTKASDYTNYADGDTYGNVAKIVETGKMDDAAVTVSCYIPQISKTASGAYGERHEWDVEKTVTPAMQNAFAGSQVTYEWTVVVTEEIFEEGFVASGTITVKNHNPEDAMTVALSDVVNGTPANISACTDDGNLSDGLTVAAGGTATCNYSAALSLDDVDKAPTNNTATAVLNNIAYSASDPIEWTATVTRGSATVTDDQIELSATIGDGATFTGSEQYTCSSTAWHYTGDGTYTFSEENTAIVTSGGAEEDRDSASETINCFAPVVSKTAGGTYDERHEWDVEKTVFPITQSGFAGDTLPFDWTVTVTESVFEENFDVAGAITVQNPAPMAMAVALADVLSDSTAAIIGTCTNGATYAVGSLTIPANTTTECGYTARDLAYSDDAAAPTGNTATATLNGIAFGATDPIEWAANVIRDDAELTDLQGPLNTAISGSGTWTINDSYTCSTDSTRYTTNYGYEETIYNTAKVTSEGKEQDRDTTSTVISCFVPQISKTAAGAYDERHEWNVAKSVTPVSQSAFAGDTVNYEWTVTVVESVYEETFFAFGTITLVNHNPEDAMTVALSDLVDGKTATISSCTGDDSLTNGLTVAAGKTSICDYTAALTLDDVDNAPKTNTATATLNGVNYTATDPIEWTPNVIRGSATLKDDQNPNLPLTITDGGTWRYTEQHTCTTDKSAYDATTHSYTFDESNTATLTAGSFSDSSKASTAINCYVPTISKDANGRYDEVHDWEVFKSVNTASQTAFAGEKKNFTWTVRVDETTHGERYLVTGKITVVNPNPEDALTVALSDKLNENSTATIGACTGGTWSSPNLTVPAGDTATCDYTVTPKGDLAKFAAALPATVTINSAHPGPESYWLTTVSNDAALNGVYESWCVDIDHTMNPGTNYTANVYSSYELYPTGLIEKSYNMDLVNWIINQDYVGKPAGGSLGSYTYGDVQRAIWELIEDNPTANTNGLGAWNQTRVNQIKAAAATSGEGFTPSCGDFVAVLLVPTGGQQPIAIAQVTFASLGVSCAESNVATAVLNGVEFPATAPILWTVNKINETATLDDDQKSDWPTTVSADTTFSYQDPQGYTCSTDPAAYTDGFYQYNESNTALLTYQTGSDTATAGTAVKCYAPVVSKTATGAYDERHEWNVEKSVTPPSLDILAGSTGNFAWTIMVVESVFEENFVASGTISVKNPRTDGIMTVKLSDVFSDGFVPTITGCTGGTWNSTNNTVAVPSNTTAVCSYTASLTYGDDDDAPMNNTVTAELLAGSPHLVTTASDAVEWAANVIRASATLDDDQNPNLPPMITDGSTWTYDDSYTCSTDQGVYTNGVYTHPEQNTATVTSGDKSDSATADTSVTCHAPVVTKNVTPYFNRDWDWTITKVEDATYNLFAGGSVTHNYKVTVDPTYTDNFWGVKGNITIANSHPTQAMVLTSVSDLAGGINGPVTCPSRTVPAGSSLTCTYDTGAQTAPNANPFGDLNTATALFAEANWTGSAAIVFSATPSTEDEPVITVDDDKLTGESWSVDRAYAEWSYTKDFTCSTNPADYTDGAYDYSLTNTAKINETGQTDTATVDVNCYGPKVTKTAVTYWNRDWDWTIVKDFDGSYNLFAGDSAKHDYTVKVTKTYTDSFWGVKGTITVYNDHPTEDMTLTALTDVAGGIDGHVTCDSLVVPARGSLTCSYDTDAQDSPADNPFGGTNTATAGFAGAGWTGTYPIVFSADPTTEDQPVVTVDDDNLTGESWSAARSNGAWSYTKDFVCSTNPADYTDGKYAYSHTNTATINETGQTEKATVDVTCYWPQIDLAKSGDELSKIGDEVHYAITVTNQTPVDAGLRALSCTISDPKIGFGQTVTLASGAKAENPNLAFTIPAGASDPFVNIASVTCKPVAATAPVVGDGVFAVSDTASWSTNLFQPAVEIVKTGPAYATSGDVIEYSFMINNLSSSDSPNLMLDTLTDDILGDLADEAPAACDELAPGASCTFTVNYSVPDVGLQAINKTNIVTVHYHPAGFPNDITDTDDHTVVVTPKSQLTDTSFCPLANNQFRLLYHLETAPNIYRLQGSNPGQYYFNGFYFGTPGTDFTMELRVPYPFVTQEGAGVPIQVHDGTRLTSGGCYSPNPSLSGFTIGTQAMLPKSSAGNQIITPEDYTTKNLGSYTTVTVSGKVPATGMVYVTIHLDFGLKKTGSWKSPGTSTLNPVSNAMIPDLKNETGFGSGAVIIKGYQEYRFGRTVGSDINSTKPASYNEIKKFAGFLGFALEQGSGKPVKNMKVVIYSPNNAVLATLYTDEDGYYMFPYKHTSKSATYTVKVPADNQSKSITVKANGFAPVDFDVSPAAAQSTQAGFAPAEVGTSAGPIYLPVIIR